MRGAPGEATGGGVRVPDQVARTGHEVRVLGPTQVVALGGHEVQLRGRERAVVSALTLAGGGPVTARDLADLIWLEPPPTAVKAIHNHVRRIRLQISDLVVTVAGAYHLGPDVAVDVAPFVEVARATVEGRLPGSATTQAAALEEASARWRGTPYQDLPDDDATTRERSRLLELRHVVDEELAACLLATGAARAAALRLDDLAHAEPYRERRWALLALACYRAGRRRDALAALHRARAALGAAGIDPGDDLHRLESLVLADDPTLLVTSPRLAPGPDPVADVAPLGTGPFVGRRDELDLLASAVARAASTGRAQAALVVGGSGMGKTTLADRLVAELGAEGHLVLQARCERTPAGALAPLAQLVHALIEVHGVSRVSAWAGDDLATLARLAPDSGLDPRRRSRSATVGTAPAAVALLASAARMTPITCVVDDLHWAPPSTARALQALVAVEAPLAVVGLARPEGREVLGPSAPGPLEATAPEPGEPVTSGSGAPTSVPAGPVPLELAELTPGDVSAYVRGTLGTDVDDDLVQTVWDRGGGHPLLTTELVSAIATGRLPGDELPVDLAGALARRMEGLAADTRATLQAASVLGATFAPAVLQHLVGGPCARALAEATEAGLVVAADGDGPHRFRHELARDLLYASMPAGVRVELHEAVGLVLAEVPGTPASEVAHHLGQAADLDPRRAAAASRAAGNEAAALFAHEEAAAHHAREAELVERSGGDADPDLGPALARWGEELRLLGGTGCVDVLLRAAAVARRAGDGDLLARATWSLCQLGTTTEVGPPAPELDALVDEALASVRDPELAVALGAAASLLYSLSGTPRCRPLYDEAERRARTEAPGVLHEVLPFAYLAVSGPDDVDRRRSLADELEALAAGRDDPVARFEALHLRFSTRLVAGEPGLADVQREMAALAQRVGDPGRRWTVCYQQATLHHLAGDLGAAEATSEEGLGPLAEGVAPSRCLAVHGAQLVALRADQGRLAELAPLVEELVTDQGAVPAWRAVLVAALDAAGEHDRACRELRSLAADSYASLPRDMTWSAAMVVAARAAAALGDADLVAATYDLLAPLSGRMSWAGTCTYGPVDEALGQLCEAVGRDEAARRHHERAVAVARRIGAPAMAERAARRSEAVRHPHR